MSTVGQGDFSPITIEGRLVATLLMLTGAGLVGTVTGSMVSWFGSAPLESRDQELNRILAEHKEIQAEIDALRPTFVDSSSIPARGSIAGQQIHRAKS